ncbi:hypothetical protein Gogos_009259, partial [Gossypium gossypioides]|nr:hypothetical protein [Gossypium gossypioides]
RALDRRLYLLLYGNSNAAPTGKPVWYFPEKVYDSEETLRKCAESALAFVLGDLSHTYFVGNAPMGHMVIQQMENVPEPFKRFFFKSQVIDTNKFDIQKCEGFVWVTKDELLEYFPEQAEFFKKFLMLATIDAWSCFILLHIPLISAAIMLAWSNISLVRPFMGARGFSSTSEEIVASVLFERLPVVIPKLDPVVYAFQEFS